VPPEPLAAVRRIADTDPDVLESVMPAVLTSVLGALHLEPRGQTFHRRTVAAAASVLFGFARRHGASLEFFPAMLRVLPPRDDASYIYDALVAILQSEQERILAAAGGDLIAALARTFCLRDEALEKLGIPVPTATSLVHLLGQLAQQPGADEIIRAAVQDDISEQRLAARLFHP
jgi:hypothetical protein